MDVPEPFQPVIKQTIFSIVINVVYKTEDEDNEENHPEMVVT